MVAAAGPGGGLKPPQREAFQLGAQPPVNGTIEFTFIQPGRLVVSPPRSTYNARRRNSRPLVRPLTSNPTGVVCFAQFILVLNLKARGWTARIGDGVARAMLTAASVFVAANVVAASAAAAEAPAKYGNALDIAPADAAFFSDSLRMKEQIDIIAHSKAWQKFTDIPAVKQAWGGAEALFIFQLQPYFSGEENQQLLACVGDLFSHEIFLYGDQHSVETISLVTQLYNSAQYWAMMQSEWNAKSGETGRDSGKEVARHALETLDKNRDKIVTPTIVIGFKHTDAARAKAQLARLEKLINENIGLAPQLKDRFHRRTIGDGDYLTLSLNSEMLPWNEIPRKEFENKPGEFDKLFDKLKHLPLEVSLGVRSDYVLLSIGPTSEHLARLGAGPRLAERPEFASVAKFADKRLTSIEFSTKEARIASEVGGLSSAMNSFERMLGPSLAVSGVPEAAQSNIRRDLQSFKSNLLASQENLGATCGVSFLTERGIESYSYDWSENLRIDGSKRLDLVDHLGGSPLVALVTRTKYSPDDYAAIRKFVQTAYGYFNEFAVPKMKPAEKKEFDEFLEFAKPLIARIDAATGSMLLPGLADGQTGLVIDAKLSSRLWFKQMPKSAAPLPMIEPAARVRRERSGAGQEGVWRISIGRRRGHREDRREGTAIAAARLQASRTHGARDEGRSHLFVRFPERGRRRSAIGFRGRTGKNRRRADDFAEAYGRTARLIAVRGRRSCGR